MMRIAQFILIFYLIFPHVAYAYIDPGSGSYILQVILAVLAGLAISIRTYWTKLKVFFVNLFSRKSNEENE